MVGQTTALGCLPPTVQPRATDNIPQMQSMIGGLIASRHAYEATEAYLTDVSRPLKAMLPDYRAAEHKLWLAIAERFDLPVELPFAVKQADNISLIWEQRDLMNGADLAFPELASVLPEGRLVGLSSADAKALFLKKFDDLGGVR